MGINQHIWIYESSDGPNYFSNSKKAYDYAMRFEEDKPSYAVVLARIRIDGYYGFKTNDNAIVKAKLI